MMYDNLPIWVAEELPSNRIVFVVISIDVFDFTPPAALAY
jgi:hypothetical protein